jgi:hypothetical protein
MFFGRMEYTTQEAERDVGSWVGYTVVQYSLVPHTNKYEHSKTPLSLTHSLIFVEHEPANGVALFSSGLPESLAEPQAHNGDGCVVCTVPRKGVAPLYLPSNNWLHAWQAGRA